MKYFVRSLAVLFLFLASAAQSAQLPDFNKAYQPEGLTQAEFETYGATCRTLLQFLAGYDELIGIIRKIMIVVK